MTTMRQPADEPTVTEPDTEDRFAIAQLVRLALDDDDPDVAFLAGEELLLRFGMPAIPLASDDDDTRRVIRRG